MTDLIEPNLHPILVHFVIGLLFTGALALAVTAFAPGQAGWQRSLRLAGDWMLAIGLVMLVAAAAAGFQAYYTVAHDTPSHEAMTTHRNWAIATAAVFLALGAWRWFTRATEPGIPLAVAAVLAASLLAVTGWWGGNLVFRHGLGVASLPEVSGEGHDHEHPNGGHGETGQDQQGEAGHDEHGEPGHHDEAAGTSAGEGAGAALPDSPEAMADAFHAALAGRDEARVRQLLAPDVLILESGGAERSLAEYASHHMSSDMAFLSSVDAETLSRRSGRMGDTAWVATETALRGRFRERDIAVKSQESLVMHRTGDGWRIVHVHWSNSELTGDETPEPPTEPEAEPDAEDEHDHGDHEH